MEKVLIFGAGGTGRAVCSDLLLKKNVRVVAMLDNDPNKWGNFYKEIPIKSPDDIPKLDFERIFLAANTGMNSMTDQLLQIGVPIGKIDSSYVYNTVKAREVFLRNYAQELQNRFPDAAVAEAGVFRGEFAEVINRCFPTHRLYLFDTFESFDARDLVYEDQFDRNEFVDAKDFLGTTADLVINRMPHKKQVVIRKGYFPETAVGIDDTFCFVNLDMDLYKPTLEGLHFFYPKMKSGCVILVHDYFSENYVNVKKAVNEFTEECHAIKIPIGDGSSVAILKTE